MEHTNLFLFENETALEEAYPGGNVDSPMPGVAYARPESGEENGIVYFNRMVTNYVVTIYSEDRSGVTVASAYTVETPKVLDGNTVKMNIVAPEVEGYKPRYAVEKVEFTSASTAHTIIYLAATSYTVTVHHVYSGTPLTADTEILVSDVFEEDVVTVKIEPEDIPGYMADPAYISVSGDMEYTLEYERGMCYVDLGLPSGTLWACKNLGAVDEYDTGDFYAWGEIQSKSSNLIDYTWNNYRYYDDENDDVTKYNYNDGKTSLEAGDDAANYNVGGSFHMPTAGQWYELYNNCVCTPIMSGSSAGNFMFQSTINGATLIVPTMTGDIRYGTEAERTVCFWTNELDPMDEYQGMLIYLGCETHLGPYGAGRYLGAPIRPVIGAGPVDSEDPGTTQV